MYICLIHIYDICVYRSYNTLTKIYIFFGCCVEKIISGGRMEAESNMEPTEMIQVEMLI